MNLASSEHNGMDKERHKACLFPRKHILPANKRKKSSHSDQLKEKLPYAISTYKRPSQFIQFPNLKNEFI